jgi:hypothetical protein
VLNPEELGKDIYDKDFNADILVANLKTYLPTNEYSKAKLVSQCINMFFAYFPLTYEFNTLTSLTLELLLNTDSSCHATRRTLLGILH